MRRLVLLLVALPVGAYVAQLPPRRRAVCRHVSATPARSRLISAGFFDNLFKEDAETTARKDAQLAEQQAILARRRNPAAQAASRQATEAARAKASQDALDKIAWQRDETADPLKEWKRRKDAGDVSPLGYEDEPQGGIPMPMASFGVGGEFGVGGKLDNGERFDLRLPYVDQGWVEGAEEQGEASAVPFWENLASGGKLQREAEDARAAREAEATAE